MLSGGVHGAYAEYETDPDLSKDFSLVKAANAAGFYNDIAVRWRLTSTWRRRGSSAIQLSVFWIVQPWCLLVLLLLLPVMSIVSETRDGWGFSGCRWR